MTKSNNRSTLTSEIKFLVQEIEKLACSFIHLHKTKYDITHLNAILNSCVNNIRPIESNLLKDKIIFGTSYSFNFKNFYFSFRYLTTPKLNKISTNDSGEIIFLCAPYYKNLLSYKIKSSFDFLFFTKTANTFQYVLKYKSSLLNTKLLFFYSFNNLLNLKKDLEELYHYLKLSHSLFFLFDLIEGKNNLDSFANKDLFNDILNNPNDFKIPFWLFVLHSSNSKSIVSILEYVFKINPSFLDNLSLEYFEKILILFGLGSSFLKQKQNINLYFNFVEKIKNYKDVEKSLNIDISHNFHSHRKSRKVQKI